MDRLKIWRSDFGGNVDLTHSFGIEFPFIRLTFNMNVRSGNISSAWQPQARIALRFAPAFAAHWHYYQSSLPASSALMAGTRHACQR
jgi:hypothetical protein